MSKIDRFSICVCRHRNLINYLVIFKLSLDKFEVIVALLDAMSELRGQRIMLKRTQHDVWYGKSKTTNSSLSIFQGHNNKRNVEGSNAFYYLLFSTTHSSSHSFWKTIKCTFVHHLKMNTSVRRPIRRWGMTAWCCGIRGNVDLHSPYKLFMSSPYKLFMSSSFVSRGDSYKSPPHCFPTSI